MMEKEKSTFDNIIEEAQEYFNAKQQLATLKIAEKSSKAISAAVASLLVIGLLLITILFASIALGFALSNYFGSEPYGFLTVAGLYLVIMLILYVNRDKWVIKPMMNTVIKNFFNDYNDGTN